MPKSRLKQLAQDGAGTGDVVAWDGSKWAPSSTAAGLTTKSGTIDVLDFTGNPKIEAVVFSTPFPDADYTVSAGPVSSGSSFGWSIIVQLDTGFTISLGANNVGDLDSFNWTAVAHGET